MNETRGTDLHPEDRAHVLRAYVHRMTTEAQRAHPEFAQRMKQDGWRMAEQSDAEWLKTTFFRVRKDGRLDRRAHYCHNTHSEVTA